MIICISRTLWRPGFVMKKNWEKNGKICPIRQHKFVLSVGTSSRYCDFKNLLFSIRDLHMPGTLCRSTYWVTYGEAQRKCIGDVIFAQTVAFSLKKTQNTMNLMWLRGYYSFCFQAVRMTLNSKLQVRSLIFCLADVWHLDETV